MSIEYCNYCGGEMSPFEEDPDDIMACGYWGCEFCNPARKRERDRERKREEQASKEQGNG